MRNPTKVQMNEFIKNANSVLNTYPTVTEDFIYTHSLDTHLGKLFIKIDEEISLVFTIYMRFDNAKEARKHYDCNPFSGKCNIHEFDAEDAVNIFSNMLKYIMSIKAEVTT